SSDTVPVTKHIPDIKMIPACYMALATRKAAHRIDERPRTGDVLLSESVDFAALLLSQPVLGGLRDAGFERPSPIQLKAIPLGRCGLDLIVQAKSGTGKTCVFSAIALDSLILENPATQVLVLAPTREIAVQIHSVITAIGIKIEGLECHVFIGGTPLTLDKMRLKKCHIAVGSPGRIKQLIEIGYLLTAGIRLFVLDEADKLLEEGSFQEQINWIYSSLPVNKQMLALSATYPECLAQHLTRYMRDPTFIRLNPTDPALIGLKQFYKIVNSYPLPHKIFEEKVQHLLELFSKVPFNQALVFSNLHSRYQSVCFVLLSFPAPSGSMNQNQRLEAMAKLKQFQCRVLISTDLTSRGIDAEKVNLVINLDIPQDWETYMHRIGRAGRFGTHGLAVTYCCRGEEENELGLIAQRCCLQLVRLPDPIPSGLLDEAMDWDTEMLKVPSGEGLPGADASGFALAKAEPALPVKHRESPVGRPQPNSSTSTAAKPPAKWPPRPRKVPAAEAGRGRRQAGALVPDHIREKVGSALAARGLVSGGRSRPEAGELSQISAEERAALQEALPKVPPLTAFKMAASRRGREESFIEIVEDYERFLRERIQRPVELVKQWRGPGRGGETEEGEVEILELMGREENEALFLSRGDALRLYAPRKRVRPQGSGCDPSSDSESDSASSRSSGREASPEEEEEETPPIPPAPSQRQLTAKLRPGKAGVAGRPSREPPPCAPPPPRTPPPAPARLRAAEESRGDTRSPPDSLSEPRGEGAEGERSLRGGRKTRSEGWAGAEIPGAERHRQRPAPGPHSDRHQRPPTGRGGHSEYWRSYYQAWHQHCTGSRAASDGWLRAYQMNSVYLTELLKP
uniref:RNA helicase n=1 Tax=Callorhinchus milii TaxID=7868 RepID=A0A4W3ITW0_CALMI